MFDSFSSGVLGFTSKGGNVQSTKSRCSAVTYISEAEHSLTDTDICELAL